MLPQSQFVFNGSMAPSAPDDMYAAIGKNGQFINIVPSQNLVWIRMGEAPATSLVPINLNEDIWQYLNKLKCNPVGISENRINSRMDIYPNPVSNTLSLDMGAVLIERLEVYSIDGTLIYSAMNHSNNLDVSGFDEGIYIIRAHNHGNNYIRRFIKQ